MKRPNDMDIIALREFALVQCSWSSNALSVELSSPNLTSITSLLCFRKALKTLFKQFVPERF